MLHLLIDFRLADNPAVNQRFYKFILEIECSRHLKVKTSFHNPESRICGSPVRHHESVKAPFLTQIVPHKKAAFRCMDIIYKIVTGHN